MSTCGALHRAKENLGAPCSSCTFCSIFDDELKKINKEIKIKLPENSFKLSDLPDFSDDDYLRYEAYKKERDAILMETDNY